MKRKVQRNVTAECAYKIMKREVHSMITAECEFEIASRVVKSNLIAECASKKFMKLEAQSAGTRPHPPYPPPPPFIDYYR